MLQHAFYDAVGPLPVVVDLFQVLLQIAGNGFGFGDVSLVELLVHFIHQFRAHLREVVHKVERVLDLVGDAGRELAQACHFFRLDELGLGGF